MKILFLDVDGVLNSAEWFAKQEPTKNCCTVDPKAVRRVLRVVEATGAKLVLSSSWRLVPELVEYLREQGLPIHDVTPRVDRGPRGAEIALWLAGETDVEAFAIVDDDPDAGDEGGGDGYGLTDRFVRTHWKHGLYGKHERKLMELLA